MTDQEQTRQRVAVTSFEDLNDHVQVTIVVPRLGGVDLEVPVRELSYMEWVSVEIDDPLPTPPQFGTRNGPVYDRNAPEYREKVARITDRWAYRRLLLALMLKVPGDTVDEQIESLRKLGASIVRTLVGELNTMHDTKIARVEGRAGGFQREGVDDLEAM